MVDLLALFLHFGLTFKELQRGKSNIFIQFGKKSQGVSKVHLLKILFGQRLEQFGGVKQVQHILLYFAINLNIAREVQHFDVI